MAPGEQQAIDRVAPGATFEHAVCRYSDPAFDRPGAKADWKIFSGGAGMTQAKEFFDRERAAATGFGVDYADVPGLKSEAFAWYYQPELYVAARSGNAYVVVLTTPGPEAAKDFDKLQPLQQQVPALTTIMKDVLTALR
ncbi:hypothetical protein ACTOB_005171 [Actinoplanes oblitus]|uniref:Uncharacterized protein n=1 Tax=Actinoplanes oblitus TaxID=3040509 RepID=A0ABY8W5U8_9ACTN|nr:hypothetical protein [Actinoplanes oblitus]WIM93199.1 hypothetical protein ACTOB_005171 [Actinoplanes oblitus]